jgi:hypothetical protein
MGSPATDRREAFARVTRNWRHTIVWQQALLSAGPSAPRPGCKQSTTQAPESSGEL